MARAPASTGSEGNQPVAAGPWRARRGGSAGEPTLPAAFSSLLPISTEGSDLRLRSGKRGAGGEEQGRAGVAGEGGTWGEGTGGGGGKN